MKFSPVVKNATWIIICKVIQSVLSLIIGTLTARYLGPSNYGLINYAASVVAFVIPVMQLGFRSTLVQEFVKKPDNEGTVLGTALVMNLASALLSMAGVFAFVSIANKGETETIIVCVLYSINLLFQALEMSQYWFQSKLLSKYTAVVSVVAYVIVSLYRVYLLINEKSIYWFAISQALDYMIISVSLLVIYKKIGKQKLSVSFKTAKEMFSVSKHYIVSGMMVTIFGYIGNIFLKFLINESAVGYYTAAVTCVNMTGFIFAAVIDSARPSILSSKNTDENTYEKRIIQLYSIILAVTLLQGVAITVFSDLIVEILYGAAYKETCLPLRIYTWQTVFAQLGTVRNIWILAEGKQKYLWIINLLGAITSIVLNLALIPVFGISGAALSAVITQIFTNVILGFVLKPIRRNNVLLLRSLNPKYLFDTFRYYLK